MSARRALAVAAFLGLWGAAHPASPLPLDSATRAALGFGIALPWLLMLRGLAPARAAVLAGTVGLAGALLRFALLAWIPYPLGAAPGTLLGLTQQAGVLTPWGLAGASSLTFGFSMAGIAAILARLERESHRVAERGGLTRFSGLLLLAGASAAWCLAESVCVLLGCPETLVSAGFCLLGDGPMLELLRWIGLSGSSFLVVSVGALLCERRVHGALIALALVHGVGLLLRVHHERRDPRAVGSVAWVAPRASDESGEIEALMRASDWVMASASPKLLLWPLERIAGERSAASIEVQGTDEVRGTEVQSAGVQGSRGGAGGASGEVGLGPEQGLPGSAQLDAARIQSWALAAGADVLAFAARPPPAVDGDVRYRAPGRPSESGSVAAWLVRGEPGDSAARLSACSSFSSLGADRGEWPVVAPRVCYEVLGLPPLGTPPTLAPAFAVADSGRRSVRLRGVLQGAWLRDSGRGRSERGRVAELLRSEARLRAVRSGIPELWLFAGSAGRSGFFVDAGGVVEPLALAAELDSRVLALPALRSPGLGERGARWASLALALWIGGLVGVGARRAGPA